MSRKALAWTILAMLAVVAILPLYLRGAFNSSLSDVYEAAPASKVSQQEQQSRFATRVASAIRAPIHQIIDRMGVWEEVENVNVEPSGAVVGQLIEGENIPLDPAKATGILSASMEAESNEHAETPEAENVNVEPSGAVVGQLIESENPPLGPEEIAATGIVSQ